MSPDLPDVVLGGGNEKKLKTLPPGCRAGTNTNAFRGGFRMWAGVDAKGEPLAKDAELPAKDTLVERRKR